MTMSASAAISAAEGVRTMVSLREAFVLAEISDVKKVRKDIENGWLTRSVLSANRRLWFRWADVILLGAVYRNHYLTGELRKRALERVKESHLAEAAFLHDIGKNVATFQSHLLKIRIDDCLYLDIGEVLESIGPRIELYLEGLKRIEEKSAVLDGEPVFKNTRLSVLHIGKMFERGESIENILEDYPYLEGDDVRFAQLYYRAHPAVGRPRTNAEAEVVGNETGVR